MAGHFELFIDHQSRVRFRLLAPDGAVLAVSGPFDDKKAAAAAIYDVRECAGTGLIEDHSVPPDTRIPGCVAGFVGPTPLPAAAGGAETGRTAPGPQDDPGGMDGFTVESEAVAQVLADLAAQAVTALSRARLYVSCGFTVARPKRSPAFGGSGELALALNELQERLGEGPGVTARTEQATVLVRDLTDDGRWPLLARSAPGWGIGSVLAVPFRAEGDASTLMTVCADRTDAFDQNDIDAAERFAGQAVGVLRPALRIAELKDTVENLHAALASRTVIDTAVGVVMAQNRCGHDAAFAVLVRAASTRNVKLRDVAAAVVASVAKEDLPVHFDA